jgi:LysM repeat protein
MGVHTVNKEKPIRDQAERLRKRVERKTEHTIEKKTSLPPRSDLHRQKQKKTKVKVKYPVIRLMALLFILLPISFFSIISYLDDVKGPLNSSLERAGVELINVENHTNEYDSGKEDTEEDEAAPAIEEVTEPKQIEVAAASPAPDSSGDKNSPESPASAGEQEKPTEAGDSTKPEAESADLPAEGETGSGEKIIFHTVKPSETLFRVAMTYYKSQEGIPIIKKANNIQGNEIQAGQVLKIPIKK